MFTHIDTGLWITCRGVTYTSAQVARMCGVSYRQLDYWCRAGLVTPSVREAAGQGSQRQWARADLERVRRVATASQIRRMPLAAAISS